MEPTGRGESRADGQGADLAMHKIRLMRPKTTLHRSSRLLKSTVVGLDRVNPLASVVVFQYSLDTLMCRLKACSIGGDDSKDGMNDDETTVRIVTEVQRRRTNL